jgi:hypothetical protein
MWGLGFPPFGFDVFPFPRDIEKNFTRVPERVRRKMTYSDVVSLYQKDLG